MPFILAAATQAAILNHVPSQTLTTPREMIVPDYELLHVIGHGSYGEVWLARNLAGSHVALKIVRRDAFDHDRPFEREFEGIKRFEPISRSDPSQVAILHVGRGDGFFYYVMELADDATSLVGADVRRLSSKSEILNLKSEIPYVPLTLKRLLLDQGALPAERCLEIALSLTRSLAHLHENRLVHRDVKPSNVIFVDGVAKLADIGLVTSVDATRSFVGTEGYLPPEGPGTPQADLYSLGKLLYEMSTGLNRQDFPKLPPTLKESPEHGILSELNEIIVKACAPHPSGRYSTAELMHSDLLLLTTGRSVRARRASQRRWRLAQKCALIAGSLALVAAAFQFGRPGRVPLSQVGWSQNAEAREAYRHGKLTFDQNAFGSIYFAARSFERALELDAQFPRANANLALAYWWMDPSDPKVLAYAQPFAEKALHAEPRLDEAHSAVAIVDAAYTHNWARADREARKAIFLNPLSDGAHYSYANLLLILGQTNAAVHEVEQTLNLESRYLSEQFAAFVFLGARRYDDAIKRMNEVIKGSPARRAEVALFILLPAYVNKGDYHTAIELEEACDPRMTRQPIETKAAYAELRRALAEKGPRGYWQKKLDWEKSSSKFSLDDFAEVESLERKLSRPATGCDLLLAERCPIFVRDILANYQGSFADTITLRFALLDLLNTIIDGPSIYETNLFRDIILRPETQALLVRNPKGADLSRLNRMLLKDAYPEAFMVSDQRDPVQMAILNARVEDTLNALRELELAAAQRPIRLAFIIQTEPAFDTLRTEPRFLAVLKQLGFPQ